MHNNDLKLVNKPRAGAMAAAAHVSALGDEKCILFVNWSRPEVLGGQARAAILCPLPGPGRTARFETLEEGALPRAPIRAAGAMEGAARGGGSRTGWRRGAGLRPLCGGCSAVLWRGSR